jgi:hypothetical protein
MYINLQVNITSKCLLLVNAPFEQGYNDAHDQLNEYVHYLRNQPAKTAQRMVSHLTTNDFENRNW